MRKFIKVAKKLIENSHYLHKLALAGLTVATVYCISLVWKHSTHELMIYTMFFWKVMDVIHDIKEDENGKAN